MMTQFCYEQMELYNRYFLGQLSLFLLLVIVYRDDAYQRRLGFLPCSNMCRSSTTETSCASTFATPLLCLHTNRSDTVCGEILIIDFVGERCTEMMSTEPYEWVIVDAPQNLERTRETPKFYRVL